MLIRLVVILDILLDEAKTRGKPAPVPGACGWPEGSRPGPGYLPVAGEGKQPGSRVLEGSRCQQPGEGRPTLTRIFVHPASSI